MVVEPPFTRYTMRRGREAMVGRRSLWRQRKSKTSSVNPRKTMQQMERRAHMNCENYICEEEEKKRRDRRGGGRRGEKGGVGEGGARRRRGVREKQQDTERGRREKTG